MAEPCAADACVVWLHGEGETGAAWERLEADPMFGLGTRLPWARWAFPTAPEGSWFDCEFPILDEKEKGIARLDSAVGAVHGMLEEIEASGIPSTRIVLGGFGPGAALALLAGRTYSRTLAGIAGLSGWYLRPRTPSSAAAAATPVLLCHGDDDDDVPIELYTQACARLRRDGVELSCFSYTGLGHCDCATELTVLAAPKNFITDRLRTLTPAASRPVRSVAGSEVPACKLDQRLPSDGTAPQAPTEADAAEALSAAEAIVGGLDMSALGAALDAGDEAAMRQMAEALSKGLGMEGEPGMAGLAEKLVGAAEEAQRESTACTVVSMGEAAGGGALQVVLALDGVASLVDADLHIGETQLELKLPNAAKPFVALFPRKVDTRDAGESARFNKKTGRLKLTLKFAT